MRYLLQEPLRGPGGGESNPSPSPQLGVGHQRSPPFVPNGAAGSVLGGPLVAPGTASGADIPAMKMRRYIVF